MNRLMKILVLVLVLIFSGTSVVAAADYKSFVDEMVYAPFLFEEDPADEFLAEKQEINRLYREHQFDSVSYEPLLFKIEKLMKKEVARYGEKYADFEAILGLQRAGSLYLEKELAEHLQSIPVEDIRDGLRDENNLQEFESSLNEATSVYFFHPELLFSLDKIIIKILRASRKGVRLTIGIKGLVGTGDFPCLCQLHKGVYIHLCLHAQVFQV